MAKNLASGRRPAAAEAKGTCEMDGITLYGEADRIDRFADGSLAIVDYKTGLRPGPRRWRRAFRCSSACSG
jgi:ATP-dependent helicase/nuclease subunit B